jgi:hypothetical protein
MVKVTSIRLGENAVGRMKARTEGCDHLPTLELDVSANGIGLTL